ncbi:MAG: hypothetical protein R6V32_01015, partial [Bacteroidales bacterium]
MKKFIGISLIITTIIMLLFGSEDVLATGYNSPGFVENKGQVIDDKGNERSDVLFTYEADNAKLFFFEDKIVYAFYRFEKEETPESIKKRNEGNIAAAEMLEMRIRQQRIDLEFVNANSDPDIVFNNPLDYVMNYYLGHCPEGIRNLPVYQEVKYENIFPNIDIVFRANKKGIKYDVILHPGASISDVKLKYNGTAPLEMKDGNLLVENDICQYEEVIPHSYYRSNKEPVDIGFELYDQNTFGFTFDNDESGKVEKTVVIDPTLTWSTYFENTASGSVSCLRGNNVVDANGNFFMQLNTYTADLPTLDPGGTGYYDPNYHSSGLDIYLAKFDPDRNLVWATYLGGDDGAQSNYYDHGMDTHAGDLYICGDTDSNDFPLNDQGGGAYYETYPGSSCGFLSKFDIATGEMVHSTYLNSYDYHSLGVDSQGNVAVISFNYDWSIAPDVMNRSGAYNQSTHGGDSDIFIYMFDSDLNQIWGTFFGGAGYTDAMGLVFDSNDNMFMFSRSSSTSAMIYEDPGGGAYFNNTCQGSYDCGISKFDTSGDLVWSTLYGGAGLEGLSYSNIDVNDDDDVIITSATRSTNMDTYDQGGGAYYQGTAPAGLDDGMGGDPGCGIYAKFDNNGVMLHSTYIGVDNEGSNKLHDQIQGNCNYEYLLFQTQNFPTTTLSGSYNVDNANTSEYNYMIMEMDENFSIRWASYLQPSDNYFQRLAIDKPAGRLYATGSTESASYTTEDPGNGAYFDGTYDSGTGRARAIMEFSVTPGVVTIDNASANPSSVCSGTSTDITLTASSSETLASENVYWYTGSCGGTFIGTGNPLTVNETLTSSETYYVNYDNGCSTSPCENVTVTVNPLPTATAGSNEPLCEGEDLNLTESGGDADSWEWSGPGSYTSTDYNPVISPASLSDAGLYSVTVTDINGCTNSDDVDVTVNEIPDATITDPGDFCSDDAPENLTAATAGGTWSGDGITDASAGTFDPSVAGIGTSTITYEVTESGCTGTDDIDIEVFETPDATITDPGDFCSDDAPENLTAATTGGTWSGDGITDASAGTFDPSVAGPGDHVITYDVGISGCADSDDITITVTATPDATITDPGDFCSDDAPENLTAATTGGTWSGDGITDASAGTFDPSVANTGINTVTYEVTESGCTGTDDIDIEVFETPDATITDPGDFCSDDAP